VLASPLHAAEPARSSAVVKDLPSLVAPDDDATVRARNRLSPDWSWGARAELDSAWERNFDLGRTREGDTSTLTPELTVALRFSPRASLTGFFQASLDRRYALDGMGRDRPTRLLVEQAFFQFDRLLDGNTSLQIGRQRFRDRREWLFDDELDGVSAAWHGARIALEFSATRKDWVRRDLLNDADRDRVDNYLGYLSYQVDPRHTLSAYVLARDDRSAANDSPVFTGVRVRGKPGRRLEYWAELAQVRGRDGARRIRAHGIDAGVTLEFDRPYRPALTLGWASGSGDGDRSDDIDHDFRQTGLHGNEARLHGVERVKYYGELLDPELGNLSILTASFGVRPTRRSSIELVYHDYRQRTAHDRLRDAALDVEPSGIDRDIGREVDLVLATREIRGLRAKLVFGRFLPGKAFAGRRDGANFAAVELRYDF